MAVSPTATQAVRAPPRTRAAANIVAGIMVPFRREDPDGIGARRSTNVWWTGHVLHCCARLLQYGTVTVCPAAVFCQCKPQGAVRNSPSNES